MHVANAQFKKPCATKINMYMVMLVAAAITWLTFVRIICVYVSTYTNKQNYVTIIITHSYTIANLLAQYWPK